MRAELLATDLMYRYGRQSLGNQKRDGSRTILADHGSAETPSAEPIGLVGAPSSNAKYNCCLIIMHEKYFSRLVIHRRNFPIATFLILVQ